MTENEALCIPIKGFEDIVSLDIKEILSKDSVAEQGSVVFKTEIIEDLAKFTYLSQSVSKVMLLLGKISIDVEDEDDIFDKLKEIEDIDFGNWFKDRTFKVNVSDEPKDINPVELAAKIGEVIVNKYNIKANMSSPDVIVHAYFNNNTINVGIDFSGIDLSKRDYKVYNHSNSLNGSLAYCLLRKSGWNKGKTLIDPLCGSGIIPIEAALKYSGKSPHFFQKDKLAFTRFFDFDFEKIDEGVIDNNPKIGKEAQINCADHVLACIRATKNNAKIADIDKLILPTKNDLEWLETKFDEKSIDYIVTHPPYISKHCSVKDIIKVYKELFYQAEYILKDNGRIAVVLMGKEELKKAAEENNLVVDEEIEVWQGQQKLEVVLFKKK